MGTTAPVGCIRILKNNTNIPIDFLKSLKLKDGDKVHLYIDQFKNVYLSKGNKEGFIVKKSTSSFYINSSPFIKNGYKIGEYRLAIPHIVKLKNTDCFLLLGQPIISKPIKLTQIGYSYKGGSNSLAVLYPNMNVLSVASRTGQANFSKVASTNLDITAGKRLILLDGLDGSYYMAFLKSKLTLGSCAIRLNKYHDRMYFYSRHFYDHSVKPGVYELIKSEKMANVDFYKMVLVGKPLHQFG